MKDRVLFMGTPDFAVPSLKALIEDPNYEVIGVVTQPDRPFGRKKELRMSPVKEVALAYEIPVYQPEQIKSTCAVDELMKLHYDWLITAAYGQIIPESVLKHAHYQAVNVHGSLLPKYRGGAPVQYAIRLGDKETGVTIMEMISQMDAGKIYTQVTTPISKTDTTGSVLERLSHLGAKALIEALPKIKDGTYPGIHQDESQVTFAPNIKREEEQIHWNHTAEEIDCLIRSLYPAPGAYTYLNEDRLKIWQAHAIDEITEQLPGTIIYCEEEQLWVAAGSGSVLSIVELQLAGKKRQSVAAFLKGNHITCGMHLGLDHE